ncbi:MAG: PASTA domain-containing protein [Clostridia bacterium]|nr:PASTA domain-containing protein [Clostridia bacterium]
MLQPYRCPGCMNINASGLEVCPHCGHEWGTPAAQPHHIAPGSMLKGRYTVGIVRQENADSAAYLAYDEKSGQAVILREYFPLRHAVRSAKSVLPAANASNEFRTGLRTFLSDAKAFVRRGSALAAFEANGTAYLVSPVPGASAPDAPAPSRQKSTPAPKKSGLSRPVKAVLAAVAAILILLGLLFLIGGLSDLGRGDGDLVKVPDLCGRDVEEASSILELHGISLVIVGVEYSEEPRDSVLTQEPAAGESVYEGSVVQVTLSKGEAPLPAEDGKVLVADVIYMTEAEARALLEQQGLVVITVEAESDEVQKGLVISQDPVLDTELEEGATVTLTVSIGSKKQEEAVSKPKPKPTAKPTEAPVEEPTPTPAPTATPAPTMAPNVSSGGTQPAAPAPTAKPTAKPTAAPTAEPTAEPTAAPTAKPTAEPTAAPTEKPADPTPVPTAAPTPEPEATPVPEPSTEPTSAPDPEPTPAPTVPDAPVPSDPTPSQGSDPANP